MTLQAKAIALMSLLAIGALLYAAWSYHQQQIGAAKAEARDAIAALEAKQRELDQARNDAATNQRAADDLQAEKDRLASALADQPAPVVRLCPAPARGRLPAPADAPAKPLKAATAPGDSAGVPSGTDPGRDIGPGLQLIARVADELAAQERALLERERALQP